MKKAFNQLSIILIVLIVFTMSCFRVDEMSDLNEIHRLEIVSHAPYAIEISGTQIENNVIYIDIDFGEYLFPLYFRAEPIFEGEIDRIVGIDFSQDLVLETPFSELSFYVMAKSGLARAYTIRPRVTPLDKNVALSRFFKIRNIEPEMLISEEGVIVSFAGVYGRRDTLRVFTVAGSFPVTITPEFAIAETSNFGEITNPNGTIQPFVNGETSLRFESKGTVYNLTVISESGSMNTWAIVIYHAPFVSGADGVSIPQQREGSNINPRTISAVSQTGGFATNDVFVDNHTEQILLEMKNRENDVVFPLKINLSFAVLSGVQVFGLNGSANSATFVFEDWNDVQTFYLLDTEARVSRLWSISLREWLSSANMVLKFNYGYTASMVCSQFALFGACPPAHHGPAIALNIEQTIIRSRTNSVGDIFLYMTDVRNNARPLTFSWSLTLNDLQIAVSEGAALGELPSLVWTNWQSPPRSFTVTAEDGSEKTWYINIRDMRNHVPSSEADLTTLTISRHVPNFAVFDAFEPVTIDAQERVVTLKLSYDDGVYPLQVWVSTEVSPFAQVTSQNYGADPLIFENENSEQTITITAEDGTESDWTVRLQVPPREARADVLNFQITSMTGAQLAQITRNDETGAIRVWLGASATFPVEITYVMTVSPRATASIPLRGTLTFNSYQELSSFIVTAQDGSSRNWSVRLVHEPQLPNWNLDAWTNATTPVSWATANNIATSGTTRVAGNPASGFAAQLRTGSALGQIASGSLFLGSFHFDPIVGLNDPIRLTHFGRPLATSGHIRGIEVDVIYLPGSEYISGTNHRELGSATIKLLKPRPGFEDVPFVYHGSRPEGGSLPAGPHPNNTAVYVAHKQAVFGNSPGTAWNGLPITVVSNTEWTTVQVLFDFPNGVKPDFTHLHIVFASSARGDVFEAVVGSTLRIDNVRILYKEEE